MTENFETKLKNNIPDLLQIDLSTILKQMNGGMSTTSIKPKHSKLLEILFKQIELVNFREEAGFKDDNEKLLLRHFLVTCIKKVIEVVDRNNFGVCNFNGYPYMFNGAFWRRIANTKMESFLGEAAEKMGVSSFIAKHYSFREQLLKQLLAVAQIPKNGNYGEEDEEDEQNNKVLINLSNGTFEINGLNMKLREPEKEDFLTYQLPFPYDENATCPIFKEYLETVLPDINLQKVLSEYLGYLFVKNSKLKLEKVLILYGSGANGKSVMFEIVNALLGGVRNVSNFSLQNLTNESGYYRAMLGGKLVNYTSEFNGKMDVSIFKQLVSGEAVDARLPYGEPFSVKNYGKLIFNCNELPQSNDKSLSFYRRFLIIPFKVTIPLEKQDKQLAAKIIKNELPGVLNWVMEGLKRLLNQKGFTESEIINETLNKYRYKQDTVRLFIEKNGYERSQIESIPINDLYIDYQTFCSEGNHLLESKRSFTNQLRNLDINIVRRNYGLAAFLNNNV